MKIQSILYRNIKSRISDSGIILKTIKFRNGSQFDVVGALESTLGGRRNGGLIDEIKNHDEEAINTIVLPQDVKEGALVREDYRTSGERMKKRCRIYAANGERKTTQSRAKSFWGKGVETNLQDGFYHHSKRRSLKQTKTHKGFGWILVEDIVQ